MDAMTAIAENDVDSPCWRDDSFIGLLHEARRWDERAYLKLETAFFALCETRKTDGRTRKKIDRIAARVFSYAMLTFSCHFDPNDGYSIQNLAEDDIYLWRERIQLVFEGFFAGKLPNHDTLRPQNPSALGSTGDSAHRQ
ncbi:Imm41 family immunity protein [Roseimaritima sediminicola]|uniref:Imm41 family immunity protein n=1 Tax=Roseimaritima sediminicola TaxID=2662066 RepID=UPI0012983C7B|nr:Imm41 family immunity protein [Roseimaritima sediminicola]